MTPPDAHPAWVLAGCLGAAGLLWAVWYGAGRQ